VVAGVLWCAGSGEDTRHGNSEVTESDIVGVISVCTTQRQQGIALMDLSRYHVPIPLWRLALRCDIVPNFLGSNLICRAVFGIYPVSWLYRPDHVVVEEELDLLCFLRRKLGGVVKRSDKTISVCLLANNLPSLVQYSLFGAPPSEPDLIWEAGILLERTDNFQYTARSATVIIYSRACFYTV
jgi:hypothetical protein